MTPGLARALSFTVLASTLFACGTSAAPNCSSVPNACDITKTACQEAVLTSTACEHGDPNAKPPPMRVITAAQFKTELLADANQAMADTRWDAGFAALKLFPANMSATDTEIDVTVSQTAAYYDPEKKRVSIIDSSLDSDDETNMYTLSHELTHYLQDREFGLIDFDMKYARTTDSTIATTSLVEGDAVVTSSRVLTRVARQPLAAFNWDMFENSLRNALQDDLSMSDAPLSTIGLELPYMIGSRYVEDIWSAGSRRDVDALFDDPPLAVVDMLASAHEKTMIEPLGCGLPDAPSGFSLAGVDTLGYAGAFALLQVAGQPNNVAPSELLGDAIGVYPATDASGPNGVVAWRLRFDSSNTAQSFFDAISGLEFETRLFDREVLITTSTDPTQNPLQGDDLLSACPPPSKPGSDETGGMMQSAALRHLRAVHALARKFRAASAEHAR